MGRFGKRLSKGKIIVTTTILPDHYQFLRENKIGLSEYIEKSIELMGSFNFDFDTVKDLSKRLKFFSQKTIELQADVSSLKHENTQLQMKIDVIKRKMKEKETKEGEKNG